MRGAASTTDARVHDPAPGERAGWAPPVATGPVLPRPQGVWSHSTLTQPMSIVMYIAAGVIGIPVAIVVLVAFIDGITPVYWLGQ